MTCTLYCTMYIAQGTCHDTTDENSFCGDVVSHSFNKTPWDEDNILNQIYKRKYVRIGLLI